MLTSSRKVDECKPLIYGNTRKVADELASSNSLGTLKLTQVRLDVVP